MNQNQLKKMLKELTVEPYSSCKMTYTFAKDEDKKPVVSVFLDRETKAFHIQDIEQGMTECMKDVENAVSYIIKRVSTEESI
ncbi:hypothetical protein [Salipaludibacillus sp. CF4.18]|uniref:hypothetical protein n=1 Tax=Salipaludibacillus sp. CF4.18 TaxID=3373081 RepID=UPI003EE4CA9E